MFWNVHFHSLKGFSRHVFENKSAKVGKSGEKEGADVVLVCTMRRSITLSQVTIMQNPTPCTPGGNFRSYIISLVREKCAFEETIDRWKERATHCRGYGVPVRRIEPMIEIWPKRVREYSYCSRNAKTVDGRLRLWQG